MIKIISASIISLLLIFSSNLNAGCWKAEIAGVWHSYSLNSFGEAAFCNVTIKANGNILSQGQCIYYLSDSDVTPLPILGGHIDLKPNCTFTGSINIGGLVTHIRRARLSSTRNEASGVFTVTNGSGLISAIRAN